MGCQTISTSGASREVELSQGDPGRVLEAEDRAHHPG